MKLFTGILNLIAVALIIFNSTKLNLNALFEGESFVAVLAIIASLCVILLLQILKISKTIEQLKT